MKDVIQRVTTFNEGSVNKSTNESESQIRLYSRIQRAMSFSLPSITTLALVEPESLGKTTGGNPLPSYP